MIAVTLKGYKVSELTGVAKEHVLKKYSDINTDDDFWSEYVIEDWKKKLEEQGYSDPSIMFSGFWSQGDGACFTATLDLKKYIAMGKSVTRKYKPLIGICTMVIKHSWRYYFATSTTIEYELDYNQNLKNPDAMHKLADELVTFVEKDRESLGNQIYEALEKAYEHESREEAVIETLDANDYLFTDRGVYIPQ